MVQSKTMQKVTGFVTRQQNDLQPELLVFQHPTAGIQLPAGTVEAGESFEQAAYREVAEETGLTDVRLVRHLGTETQALDDSKRALMQTTTFLTGPRADASPLNFSFGRGNWVQKVGEIDGFAEVVFEETDLNYNPPKLQVRFSGWVPDVLLAEQMERAFYHFVLRASTPERWSQLADRRIFHLFWTPLIPKPELVDSQNRWLDFVYDALQFSIAD